MLLTSDGIRDVALRTALADLLGRPFAQARLVVVLTASLAVDGDKGWLLDDLARMRSLGWAEVDLVDLHTLPAATLTERLRAADAVYVHGGNQYNLAAAIDRQGLAGLFEEIRQTKVYVGLSAGSMIWSRHLAAGVAVFGDEGQVREVGWPPRPHRCPSSTGTSSLTWTAPSTPSAPSRGHARERLPPTSRSGSSPTPPRCSYAASEVPRRSSWSARVAGSCWVARVPA